MTSVSTRKISTFVFLIAILSFSISGYYYGSSGGGDVNSEFSIPEYNSHGEIATELAAPFIAIAVILQFGFFKVLGFTLATDDKKNPFNNVSKQRAKARKQSMVLSLVVTAMLVPSPYWDWMRLALNGLTFMTVAGLGLAIVVFLKIMFNGAQDDLSEE